MKIKTKLVLRAVGRFTPDRHAVLVDGVEVGFIEKYKRTSSAEIHPWKAFAGVGEKARFLKAFYTEDGGKRAAIRAVVNDYLPYGKSVMLRKQIVAECWNFTDETTGTIPEGKTLVINHVYDATHTTCTVIEGVICSNQQRGWRFIVPNAVLAEATGIFVPAKTRDIVGDIIRAES